MNQQPPDYLHQPLGEFLDSVASAEPAPGGGSVAAIAVALAAGLAVMAARLSTDHLSEATELADRAEELRLRAAPLARADAEAYGKVLAAQRAPERSAGDALSKAADVPLAVAEAGAEVVRISRRLADHGNPNLKGDATTAVLLAEAAACAAATLAVINLSTADIRDERLERARKLAAKAAGEIG